jgi:hypothetical protein
LRIPNEPTAGLITTAYAIGRSIRIAVGDGVIPNSTTPTWYLDVFDVDRTADGVVVQYFPWNTHIETDPSRGNPRTDAHRIITVDQRGEMRYTGEDAEALLRGLGELMTIGADGSSEQQRPVY